MRWALLAFFLAAACMIGTAEAQQTSSPFKPIKAPTLDPDLYKAPNAGAEQPILKSGKEQPKSKPLNRIDVGKYQLELNAGHAKDFATGGAPISGQSADPSSPNPTRDKEPVLPDYFGLTISRPIH
jgi:hypothetical protein